MAQIAQQDNLVITSTTPIATIDAAAKKKLKECIEAGTIYDVIVVTPETPETAKVTNKSKVLAWSKDVTAPQAPTYKVALVDCNTGVLSVFSLS